MFLSPTTFTGLSTRMVPWSVTEVDGAKLADTWFPEFAKDEWQRKVLQSGEHDGMKYEMVEYTKGGKA